MIIHGIIITLTAVLMFAGLLGSFLPILPGAPLILVGAFLYAWYSEFLAVSGSILIVLLILTLLSQVLDYLAAVIGVKRYGASKWGMGGAFLGGVIGIFGGVFGILIGPFLGAFLGEWLHGRRVDLSLKIGWGTVLGLLGGAIGKVIISVIMIGIFLAKIIS